MNRVTVVITCNPEDEGPDGTLMHAVHSVEQQDYPRELVDTHIVRSIGTTLDDEALRRFGVQQADTEWVAFLNVKDVWAPDMLTSLFEMVGPTTDVVGKGHTEGGVGTLARRAKWLGEA